ncbi:hypothetical protein SVAN01_05739 [Stagonosporopsis vannaccii]|nr:hypothetical protein SVAN01_05739 [Stagonosporopsis vannaccii]
MSLHANHRVSPVSVTVLREQSLGRLTETKLAPNRCVLAILACAYVPASSRNVQHWRGHESCRLSRTTRGNLGKGQASLNLVSLVLRDWTDLIRCRLASVNYNVFGNACCES